MVRTSVLGMATRVEAEERGICRNRCVIASFLVSYLDYSQCEQAVSRERRKATIESPDMNQARPIRLPYTTSANLVDAVYSSGRTQDGGGKLPSFRSLDGLNVYGPI